MQFSVWKHENGKIEKLFPDRNNGYDVTDDVMGDVMGDVMDYVIYLNTDK